MRCGHTSLRCSGIPLLSCALVALAPVPAAGAPMPGPRPVPRAVAASPTPGPDALRPGGPAEASAERPGHGPRSANLPLPPLFGRHSQHGGRPHAQVHTQAEAHGHQDEGGRHRTRGGSAAADAHGDRTDTTGSEGRSADPSPDTSPGTDARDGAGGDRGPLPSPSSTTAPQDGPASGGGDVRPWSPAPVASGDADRTVAGGAEPAAAAAEAAPAAAPAGPMLPVLPLGAGMTSLGLGLAILALRLRRG
jgi:hypothetical protein